MLFYGIVEADETYVGGKPRKGNLRKPRGRGRGTDKTPVLGVLDRENGRVRAEMANKRSLTSSRIEWFIDRFVDKSRAILMTDESPLYNRVSRKMAHAVINHSVSYVDGLIHTNGIEGFWSLVKRAWYGTHHSYSEKYMPLYIAEACWKYNNRGEDEGVFKRTLGACVA